MASRDLQILFESEEIIAIDKPSGMIVHTDGVDEEPSVADWFVKHYPDAKDVGESMRLKTGEEIKRPGIVHRLDRDTSGVLLLAKTAESHAYLKQLFQERKISKIYHAIVHGVVKEENGTINRPIGRSSKDFRLWSAQRGARGTLREAVTDYQVLHHNSEYSYLEISPKTGRTHQIRVHMKAIHHPVVCDLLYAPNHSNDLGFDRLALHAKAISFIDQRGEQINVESPLPEDFRSAKERLGA